MPLRRYVEELAVGEVVARRPRRTIRALPARGDDSA